MKSVSRLFFLSISFLLLPLFVVSLLSTHGCDGPRVKVRKPSASQNDQDTQDDEELIILEDELDVLPQGISNWSDFDEPFGGVTDDAFDVESLFDDAAGTTDFSFNESIFDDAPAQDQLAKKKTEEQPEPVAPQPAPQSASEKFPAIVGPPTIFANLPDDLHNPDGLTVSDDQQTIFMCCPNFNGRENNEGPKLNGAFLVSFDLQGNLTKLLEFPVLEETGQFGAMGVDFGPDGHLYVCDNQYFFNKEHKSRIIRVLMDGMKPTGEIQIVVTGMKLANAILWMDNKMLVSDTALDLEGKWGSGGLWLFTKDEALKAGTNDENPPIALQPNGTDPHLALSEEVEKIGRGDNGGADGLTCTPDGTVYFGNFGDGAMYRVEFDANNKATVEMIHKAGEVFSCCDGIFYDKRTDKIYINDSEKNAIRAFKPVKAGEKPTFELIWENEDTDGTDGKLDQPCECVIIGDRMIICNFDYPFPGLRNSMLDKPYTMSVLQLK